MHIYILNATINGKLMTKLLADELEIDGVIGLNEVGGQSTSEYYDYTDFCQKENVPYYEMESYSLNSDVDKETLLSLDMDLLIIASWQRLIPEWLINHCTIGVIGTHGSHEGIMRGRGRSPQNWALMYGKKKFIFSIFWIEAGTDNGKIIDTEEFEYTDIDTILSSYVKFNILKTEMIKKNIYNGIIAKKEGEEQIGDALYLPQRTAEDGMIDWNRGCVDIYNMIRALTKPYPGAFTICKDTKIFIWSSVPVKLPDVSVFDNYDNGTVISDLIGSLLVKCSDGVLLVEQYSGGVVKEGMVFESSNYHEQMRMIVERHNTKYGTPLSNLILDEVKKEHNANE